jgi:predicted nucleic acid-binding protein
MIIVVDTNIVFSAILNTNSTIGDLILNSQDIFQFQSCNFLLNEIDNHWEKLK